MHHLRSRLGNARGTYPRYACWGGLLRGVGIGKPMGRKPAGCGAPGGDKRADGSGVVAKVLVQHRTVGEHTLFGQGDLGLDCGDRVSVRCEEPCLCDAKCHSVFQSGLLVGT